MEETLVNVHWGNCGSNTREDSELLKEFVDCLWGFRPGIEELSAHRIVLRPHPICEPVIFEGPEEEMRPLVEVAGWYREARNSPVFASLQSRTEFSFGMTPAQLCAN